MDDVSTESPIVASHNDYLLDLTNDIRSRTIPWEGYQRAGLITETELAQIRQFEKSPAAALAQAGDEYVDLFVALLGKLVRADTLQSILVLLDDVLRDSPKTAELFFKNGKQPFVPFFRLLKKEDEYVQLKSANLVTLLLIEYNKTHAPFDAAELFAWITFNLANTNASIVDLASQYLQNLLAVTEYRTLFYNLPGAMDALISALQKQPGVAQLQYQTIYSVWLMTFIPEIAKDIQKHFKILTILGDIARPAIKEKVVRVVVSTYRNLLTKAPEANIIPMLGNKILALCETLATRKYTDTEINDDLTTIIEELARHVASLTTFDEYASEVRAGRLEWSPPHQSEQFWKSNAARLSEGDYELVRALAGFLQTSSDPVVLSVAAHDIGQYVKYVPTGKRIVQEIGAKTRVMELMSHENPDVRYHALMSVQKFMANAWES
ncbi:H(+)-transporting V1 sector ATPase subunit H [Polyrhizophydium stewartii]|uniref:V-type proton ATPase subunit H n=1 Tax=Polyrhizophydium stewartii TaxID=2732419 RepID=A0ABR4MY60_9FUNG